MKNANFEEEAAAGGIPPLPEVCEYCGGAVLPKEHNEKPSYAKHHGVCASCGAEYALMFGGGSTKMIYRINNVVWVYHGDGRRTRGTKQDYRHRDYFGGIEAIGRENALKRKSIKEGAK